MNSVIVLMYLTTCMEGKHRITYNYQTINLVKKKTIKPEFFFLIKSDTRAGAVAQ